MDKCDNKLCNSYDDSKEHNCDGNFINCDPINHRQFLRDDKEPVATVLCSEGLCLGQLRDEKLNEMAEEIEVVIRRHAENNEITFAGIIGTLELIKDDFKDEAKKA